MLDVAALALSCCPAIAPETVRALVQHESRAQPFVININGSARLSRQPATAAEAIEVAQVLEAAGYDFDSGLAQINSSNVRKFNATWQDVFSPCGNLKLAARILTDCYLRAPINTADTQQRLALALSCYNTGNYSKGFTNGYVKRVYKAAESLTTQ